MWLISLLPDALMVWLVHAITALGVLGLAAGFFLTKVPLIDTYGRYIKIVGVALLVLGIYLEGGVSNEQLWRERVAELEAKVKLSEEKANAANDQIKTKVVTKVKVIKEQEVVIQERIKEVAKVIDAKCEMPKEAIDILNQAAKDPTEEVK